MALFEECGNTDIEVRFQDLLLVCGSVQLAMINPMVHD